MEKLDGQIIELWNVLPHPSTNHVVRLFAKNKEGTRFGDYARNPHEISRFINSCPNCDVYVAPNPTTCTTGIRHNATDVTHWSYLFLDVDPVDPTAHPLSFAHTALLALEGWVGQRLDDSIFIDSGRGVQIWIRLEDIPITENEVEIGIPRKIARKVMGWWLNRLAERMGTLYGCRLDTSVSDLPRVMRVPGTKNMKTGRLASFISSSQSVHTGLDTVLITGVPKTVFIEPEVADTPTGKPWQLVFNLLTKKAQDYLTKGKDDPGRHETMWHTARKLRELGISVEQARLAISYGNKLRGQDMELSKNDIEHALKTAYND